MDTDLEAILEKINNIKNLERYGPLKEVKPTAIEERVRKLALENDALAQDIKLRKITLRILFCFLASETMLVFLFTFLQAKTNNHFYLEEWSFRFLIVATISQITFMLRFAVQYLFPNETNGG